MKKIFFVLTFLIVAASFLSAATISWKWRGNDADVMYYRYRMDGSDWKEVENESYEVRYDSDVTVPHSFEIQQSYDGINWSASKIKEYVPYVEVIKAKKERGYSKTTLRLSAIPLENETVRNANTGVDDYYSEYGFGLEANGTAYFNKMLGFGITATFNAGKKKLGDSDTFINFGVYAVPAIRLVSNNNVEVALKGGVGIEMEPYDGIIYMAPSFMAQIDCSVFLGDHFSFAISPSVVFNRGDFIGGSSYESSVVRILSFGASWNF